MTVMIIILNTWTRETKMISDIHTRRFMMCHGCIYSACSIEKQTVANMRIVRVSMSENFVEYCQYVTNENTVCKKLIDTEYEILLYCNLQGIIQHQCNKVQLIRLMVSAIACTFIMTLHIKEMIDGILCLKTRKRIVQKVLRVDFQIFSY